MTFGMVSFYLFTCVFSVISCCVSSYFSNSLPSSYPPAHPPYIRQNSLIWWNISMSFSLPVSLPLPHNFHGEQQQELNKFQTAAREKKETIKRDGKLVQSVCTWEVLYIAHTHDHGYNAHTRPHLKNHDMQIRYKIYIIFMHCVCKHTQHTHIYIYREEREYTIK